MSSSSGSIARVDKRGRLVIPSRMKKHLKIGSTVRLQEKDGKLEIIPIVDPFEKVEGSAKAHVSAKQLDELSESIVTNESFK